MSYVHIPAAADMHTHLRQGTLLGYTVQPTAERCQTVLVMPNTNPPILTVEDAEDYHKRIKRYSCMKDVQVLLTLKLQEDTTPAEVLKASRAGITAYKLYPANVTTNSHDGISEEFLTDPPQEFMDCFEVMRKTGMVLCLHGEMPGHSILDRESVFLDFVDFLAYNFPKLRVVLEHISTYEQVEHVRKLADSSQLDIGATITAHHLFLTLDDVIGDKINPHNFCKPVPKMQSDRTALRKAAMSGEPWFFLGTDSAPHEKDHKECAHGCAGVYTAPVFMECLIQLFEEFGEVAKLANFVCKFGSDYYKIERTNNSIKRYRKERWRVPMSINGLRPFMAGQDLQWKLDV